MITETFHFILSLSVSVSVMMKWWVAYHILQSNLKSRKAKKNIHSRKCKQTEFPLAIMKIRVERHFRTYYSFIWLLMFFGTTLIKRSHFIIINKNIFNIRKQYKFITNLLYAGYFFLWLSKLLLKYYSLHGLRATDKNKIFNRN